MFTNRPVAAGTAFVTAAAVLLAPTAAPSPAEAADPAARLTAVALPIIPEPAELTPAPLQALDFADAAALLAPSVAAASGVADFLQGLYLGAEQWVRYGVNLVAWLAGWVPFVGLLAPQINFFYDLGESITRSTVFNTIDLLTGGVGFGQALSNIGNDTATAFQDFFATQAAWIRHFVPPLPPIFPAADAPIELDPGMVSDLDPDASALLP